MNMLEAFEQLNKLNESTADDLRKEAAEANILEKESKELKNSALKNIIEEDRQELAKLIAEIDGGWDINVTPDWASISYNKNTIYLPLISAPQTYEIDHFDDIDFDTDEPVIKTDRILDDLQTEADKEAKSIADELNNELTGSWKLLDSCDVEPLNEPEVHHYSYTSATYWDTASEDLDYDETLEYKITYYLVKEI